MAFDPHVALSKLHLQCQELGIQSFLSPIRYRVNIQGESLIADKQELLQAIDQESAELSKTEKIMATLEEQGFDVIQK